MKAGPLVGRLAPAIWGWAALLWAAGPAAADPFLLGPPPQDGPVVVEVAFEFHDVNEVDDVAETFQLSGVLTLVWRDPRLAFDPALVGADELVWSST